MLADSSQGGRVSAGVVAAVLRTVGCLKVTVNVNSSGAIAAGQCLVFEGPHHATVYRLVLRFHV